MNNPLHFSRRQWLKRTACGFGALALSDIVRAATNPLAARIPGIRARTGLPVGVGFGIRDAATARAIAAFADAVVIGSRIIQEMESSPPGKAVEMAASLLAEIRKGMDEGVRTGVKA